MMIYTHAKTKYIERVLGMDRDRVGTNVVRFASEQIEKAAKEPEEVHRDEGEENPIHIRNCAAVPVVDGEIPTTYHVKDIKG